MKVIILDPSHQHLPYHSKSLVVRDQLEMLASRPEVSQLVHVVFEDYDPNAPGDAPKLRGFWNTSACLPVFTKTDYTSARDLSEDHRAIVDRTLEVLRSDLADADLVITHDVMFLGWNLPINLAVQRFSDEFPDIPFLHWVHSIPSMPDRDFWVRPSGSRIVIPSNAHRRQTADLFHTPIHNVAVIPHAAEAGNTLTPPARYVWDNEPLLRESLYTQLLPVSADRMEPKGLDHIIKTLGAIQKLGKRNSVDLSACLLVFASHWDDKRDQHKEGYYSHLAASSGLGGDRIKFLPPMNNVDMRSLMTVSSISINPTTHESHGMVMDEMALAGVYQVLNEDLPVVHERFGDCLPLLANLGSTIIQHTHSPEYHGALAQLIVNETHNNPIWMMRQKVRIKQSWKATWMKIEGEAQRLVNGR